MGFAFLAIGSLFAYLAYLGSDHIKAAGSLLYTEMFTGAGGNNPYYKWLGPIILVALLGYVPALKPISTALLVLIVLSIVLSKRNSFTTLIGAV